MDSMVSGLASVLKVGRLAAYAAQVDRFVARMPDGKTDAQRMVDHWREQVRNRTLERGDIEPPAPQVR